LKNERVEMIRKAFGRSAIRLVFLVTFAVIVAPLSALAASHDATRTDASFTSTQIEIVDPGKEWVDDAGIYHVRGLTEIDDITGDITGTGEIVISIDFLAPGECTEDSCPGYTEIWGTVDIENDEGRWTGRFTQSISDVPGSEYAFTSIALHGRGGYAGMSFFGEFVDDSGTSVTIAGTLSTMALPTQAFDVNVTLCFTEDAVVGNYLGTGAVDGFGHAEAVFLGAGLPGTHKYNLFGAVELTDDLGTVDIGFVGGSQDVGFSSFGFGNYVITGGTGAYEELYGNGRVIGAAQEIASCEYGFGVRVRFIGTAHYN
jgi:hypothetical protein